MNTPRPTTRFLCGLCLAAAALSPLPASATSPVEVNGLERSLDIDAQLYLLEDPSGSLTIDAVRDGADGERLAPIDGASPNFGFTHSAWWVRVDFTNSGDWPATVLLRQDYQLIDYLDVWRQGIDGDWQQVSTGDQRVFSSRDMELRDFVFRVAVPPQGERSVYLRYETSGAMNISLSVATETQLISVVSREQLGYGIYFGGFLVLLLYNLVVFAAVRDRVFFYYLLYLASYGVYFGIHNGLTFQYLWPNNPWWGNKSLVVFLAATLFWVYLFSRSVLDSARVSPRLDKAVAGLQWVSAAGLVGAVFLPYATIILPLAALSAMAPPVLLWMGARSLMAGHGPARYFLLAWSVLLIGVTVYMAKTFGLLPHNFVTQYGFQIGSLIEMVLLSLALASRVSELQHDSVTDALTGLYNRRSFDEKVAEEFARSQRYGQPLSVMLIDADHFKSYNDEHGHSMGDAALKAIADRLRATARRTDRVCRYGGEEFVIVMPATNRQEAQAHAERQRRAIEELDLATGELTISVGLATQADGLYASVDALLEAADQALYAAKARGRNCLEMLSTEIVVPG
ncbi:MAG: diguanylate cyclase [Pseudomonadota bacterium]